MGCITGCHEENLDKLKDLCSEPLCQLIQLIQALSAQGKNLDCTKKIFLAWYWSIWSESLMFNIKRIVDSPMLTHRVSFLTLCVSCTGVFHRRHATDKGGPIVPDWRVPWTKGQLRFPPQIFMFSWISHQNPSLLRLLTCSPRLSHLIKPWHGFLVVGKVL